MNTQPHDARSGRDREWLAEHFLPDGVHAKMHFKTYTEAKIESDYRNERDKDEPDYRPSNPYLCGYCNYFHIGHSNAKRRGRRKKR